MIERLCVQADLPKRTIGIVAGGFSPTASIMAETTSRTTSITSR